MDRSSRHAALRPAVALGLLGILAFGSGAWAQTPSAAQPVLPQPLPHAAPATSSPIVDSIAEPARSPLVVHKRGSRHAAGLRHTARYRHHGRPIDVERPALAGVLLIEPIPAPVEQPRPIVPMPAYFIDGIASAFTTPPPPVVCLHCPRDPSLPDPRLYREVPLACGYDVN